MPQFYPTETVHVEDDAGDYVRGFIQSVDGNLVVVRVIDGEQKGTDVERTRGTVYSFSLPRWMQGKRRAN